MQDYLGLYRVLWKISSLNYELEIYVKIWKMKPDIIHVAWINKFNMGN